MEVIFVNKTRDLGDFRMPYLQKDGFQNKTFQCHKFSGMETFQSKVLISG